MAGGQPNRAQNGSKVSLKSTPKQTPEDQNEAPKRYWISDSILASILSRLGRAKGLPKGSQNRSKIALGVPGPPKGLQGAPGSPPEASRDPFWPHFGTPGSSFSSLPSVLFEVSARPAIRSKTLFEITCQKDSRDHCGTDAHNAQRLSGRFGAAGPLEIRPLSRLGSTEAVKRSGCFG